MFVPFAALGILSVLWFVLNTSGGFFGGTHLLKLLISPELLIALFNTFASAGIPALLLSGVYALAVRKKKSTIGRRKYYTYLFLISLVSPVVLILVLTGQFDLVNNTIYTLQIGLVVVFLHWVTEWIVVRSKNRKKAETE